MSGRWLRLREVARRLDVSARTVRRYIADGRLPAHRLPSGHWRVQEGELALGERQAAPHPPPGNARSGSGRPRRGLTVSE